MSEGADPSRRAHWEQIDAARYHERTGWYGDSVDAEVVAEFLSERSGLLLDLPCGSGRLNAVIRQRAPTIGADISRPMLRFAAKDPEFRGVRSDVFNLAFRDSAFSSVVCLRLSFHYPDLTSLLRELSRVTRPGQQILFDTLNRYSVRWLIAGLYNLYRGQRATRVVFRSREQVEQAIRAAGLVTVRHPSRYLLPTRMYRILPCWLCRLLDRVERWAPAPLRVLTFWSVSKPPS